MKKFLTIVFLSLLYCNISYAVDAEDAKKACRDMGYETGTEEFTDCALDLVLNIAKIKSKNLSRKKDCAHLKGGKIHKYISCMGGSKRYDDDEVVSKKVKEKHAEGFNEKYNSIVDLFKKEK